MVLVQRNFLILDLQFVLEGNVEINHVADSSLRLVYDCSLLRNRLKTLVFVYSCFVLAILFELVIVVAFKICIDG